MNGLALLGILMLIYGIAVIGMVIKKPQAIWSTKKVQFFMKVLGEKGTDIFFIIFAVIVGGSGIILMVANR